MGLARVPARPPDTMCGLAPVPVVEEGIADAGRWRCARPTECKLAVLAELPSALRRLEFCARFRPSTVASDEEGAPPPERGSAL